VRGEGENMVIVGVYVDDMIIMSKSKTETQAVKKLLTQTFQMVDFGRAQVILGIRITHDLKHRVLKINQESYVRETLAKFNMTKCTGVTTPMSKGTDLGREQCPKTPEERAAMADKPYSSLLGRLMYLMVSTRPDLASAVQILSRFMSNPGESHWRALKRLLQYLKYTANHGITYRGDQEIQPVGFSDADFAGCKDSRKSTSGYVFMMGGGAVSWSSKRQTIVATSTCEAEYVAAAFAAKEAIWEMVFLSELNLGEDRPMAVHCDSQSALHVMHNAVINQRTKAIDITLHYVKELVERQLIVFHFTPTHKQLADLFTKPLGRVVFEKFRAGIGIEGSHGSSSDKPSEEGLLD
jgi:hypothetical protein